jgi:CRP-like cAMP-binding protein
MKTMKTLKRGESLMFSGEYGSVWRVTQGVFRLERPCRDGMELVRLALPGDLLGVESLCAEPYAYTATALTSAQAIPNLLGLGVVHANTLAQGFLQQQCHMNDMVRLRSGTAGERIAHLLKMLSRNAVCRKLNEFLPARSYTRTSLFAWPERKTITRPMRHPQLCSL